MRVFAVVVVLTILGCGNLLGAAPARALGDIPGARESLLRIVSPRFYKTLLISPVEGWIVVRGQLVNGTRVFGARIVHSELDGAYDKLALDLANNLHVIGYPHVELGDLTPTILVHLLVYRIKDGRLAISFAHFDTAGGSQMRYYGCAWMAVEKANHLWEPIEPKNLQKDEPRGPRTYALAVESPIARSRLPRAIGAKFTHGSSLPAR
ncbi:MAG TPA: hypothetical protein VF511_09010 [Chthoniobacterales bacterium]|jgi:hypothetical protein